MKLDNPIRNYAYFEIRLNSESQCPVLPYDFALKDVPVSVNNAFVL